MKCFVSWVTNDPASTSCPSDQQVALLVSGHSAFQKLTKVSPNDAVPRRVVLFVKLLLYEGCNVLLDVKLLKGLQYDSEGRAAVLNRMLCSLFAVLTFSEWPMLLGAAENASYCTWVAQSTASCCISSAMSAFLITAFRSVMATTAYRPFKAAEPAPADEPRAHRYACFKCTRLLWQLECLLQLESAPFRIGTAKRVTLQ